MYKREIDIKRTQDIEITRTADEVRANFPLVGGCCPTFEYGFLGAGPLELGLSALNAFVPPCSDGEDAMDLGDAAKIRFVSQFAWDFRRQFANEVLGVLPQENGVYVIKATAVREWIEARRSEQIKQAAAEESSGRERFREVIEKYPQAKETTTGGDCTAIEIPCGDGTSLLLTDPRDGMSPEADAELVCVSRHNGWRAFRDITPDLRAGEDGIVEVAVSELERVIDSAMRHRCEAVPDEERDGGEDMER